MVIEQGRFCNAYVVIAIIDNTNYLGVDIKFDPDSNLSSISDSLIKEAFELPKESENGKECPSGLMWTSEIIDCNILHITYRYKINYLKDANYLQKYQLLYSIFHGIELIDDSVTK